MKKFLIDQTLFLFVGIAIMITIPFLCGPFFTLVFELITMLCWGYLCRRLLVLPFDIVLGKVTKRVFFSCQCQKENLEFFKSTCFYIWKFRFRSNQTIELLAPFTENENLSNTILPQKDVELKITYYRFSKILLHWNQD